MDTSTIRDLASPVSWFRRRPHTSSTESEVDPFQDEPSDENMDLGTSLIAHPPTPEDEQCEDEIYFDSESTLSEDILVPRNSPVADRVIDSRSPQYTDSEHEGQSISRAERDERPRQPAEGSRTFSYHSDLPPRSQTNLPYIDELKHYLNERSLNLTQSNTEGQSDTQLSDSAMVETSRERSLNRLGTRHPTVSSMGASAMVESPYDMQPIDRETIMDESAMVDSSRTFSSMPSRIASRTSFAETSESNILKLRIPDLVNNQVIEVSFADLPTQHTQSRSQSTQSSYLTILVNHYRDMS